MNYIPNSMIKTDSILHFTTIENKEKVYILSQEIDYMKKTETGSTIVLRSGLRLNVLETIEEIKKNLNYEFVINKTGAKLLLRLMNELNPEFNYSELAELSIVMNSLEEIIEE